MKFALTTLALSTIFGSLALAGGGSSTPVPGPSLPPEYVLNCDRRGPSAIQPYDVSIHQGKYIFNSLPSAPKVDRFIVPGASQTPSTVTENSVTFERFNADSTVQVQLDFDFARSAVKVTQTSASHETTTYQLSCFAMYDRHSQGKATVIPIANAFVAIFAH